jgi:hypothetical protein
MQLTKHKIFSRRCNLVASHLFLLDTHAKNMEGGNFDNCSSSILIEEMTNLLQHLFIGSKHHKTSSNAHLYIHLFRGKMFVIQDPLLIQGSCVVVFLDLTCSCTSSLSYHNLSMSMPTPYIESHAHFHTSTFNYPQHPIALCTHVRYLMN